MYLYVYSICLGSAIKVATRTTYLKIIEKKMYLFYKMIKIAFALKALFYIIIGTRVWSTLSTRFKSSLFQ